MAVEGEAMLWKPSASNSLWDSRRLPSLPDMGTALNRSSSFEYESAAAGKAQEPPAGKDNGSKGKPLVVAKQDFTLESASKGRSQPALLTVIGSFEGTVNVCKGMQELITRGSCNITSAGHN